MVGGHGSTFVCRGIWPNLIRTILAHGPLDSSALVVVSYKFDSGFS